MAIDAQRRTQFAFDTRITTLATNTTLGTATRHDFAAKTIYVPETVAGRFNPANGARVCVRVSVRDAETTTATDFDGIRIGIKINAVAFDDSDITIAPANTGDAWSYEFVRDVTAYFNTNDPGTANFTCQVGVAFATGAASLVNNITAELIITYGYDSAAAGTYADTAIFPGQSHHGMLTAANTFVEVGTTGGTSNAPANQIQKLTGAGGVFDGIVGWTLRQRYLVILAHDGGATATDFTPQIRFDGGAAVPRAPVEQGLNTTVRWRDVYDITALSTAAAHSFEVDPGGTANRMVNVGFLDIVTYEYTKPGGSDPCYVSVQIPLEHINGANYSSYFTSSDPERLAALYDLQEPGPITMGQCGVMLHHGETNDLHVNAPGQAVRQYDEGTATVNSGFITLIHRTDHSSSTWALARGPNVLTVDYYQGGAGNINAPVTGIAFVNYKCLVHADGSHKHNRTIYASQVIPFTAAQNNAIVTPDEPVIVTARYIIQGAFVECRTFATTQQYDLGAYKLAGEDDGSGWWREHCDLCGNAELGIRIHSIPVSRWFRRRADGPTSYQGGNIESERKWHSHVQGGAASTPHQGELYVTLHAMTFTVSGAVTIAGTPVGNGEPVQVYAYVASSSIAELLATVVTGGGTGTFTYESHDDTRVHFARYATGGDLGTSEDLTPEADTFDITIAGSGDVTAPTITIVSPTPGTAPGAPGGFSADWAIARMTPIVLEVTDASPGNRYQCIVAQYPGALDEIVVYRRGAFRGVFAALSSEAAIANGKRLTILPSSGWPSSDVLNDVVFEVDVLDQAGNLAS